MLRWVAALLILTGWLSLQVGEVAARTARSFDLNGDGRQDLVAGMPLAGPRGAGAITVMLSARNRRARAWRVITQSSAGVPGGPQAHERGYGGDRFGARVASGDFDGDGYADLAVAATRERFGRTGADIGSVTILRGSRRSLLTHEARRFRGPATLTPRVPVRYGGGVVAGDLDRDGFSDLVIGAPGEYPQQPDQREDIAEYPGKPEQPPGEHGSGAIHLLFGSPSGLSTDRARTITRPRINDWEFGSLLAVADVNRDGYPDVIEGAQGFPLADEPGQTAYCPGQPGGPIACRPLGSSSGPGPTSIAIGDVTGDGYQDVVEGVPEGKLWADDDNAPSGKLRIWRGGRTGPRPKPVVITQNTPGVPRDSEIDDGFGACLDVSDVDRDGYADIVTSTRLIDTGGLTVIRGARSGHAVRGNSAYTAAAFGLDPGDYSITSTMTMLDRDGDGHADLTIGVEGRSLMQGGGGPTSKAVLVTAPATGRALAIGSAEMTALPRPSQRPPAVGTLGRAGSSGCLS